MQKLGHQEQQQLHAGIFRVIAADQFLLGFGQIERQPGGFGERGDHEHNEPQWLGKAFHMPLRADALIIASRLSDPAANTTPSMPRPRGSS